MKIISPVISSVEQLGEIIRKSRESSDLTQSQLGVASKTSEIFVLALEKGEPLASLRDSVSVLAALNMELKLVSKDGKKPH